MKLACCVFAVVASLSCYSQIQTNQLEVANHLIRTIMSSPEWNDNVKSGISVGGGDLPFQEYEDLSILVSKCYRDRYLKMANIPLRGYLRKSMLFTDNFRFKKSMLFNV